MRIKKDDLKYGLRLAETGIGKVEKWLHSFAAILVWVMMIIIVLQVMMRYILNEPLHWSLEITEYLMVAIVFFALGSVQNQHKHIRIDFLIIRLTSKVKYIIAPILTLCALFFFIILAWTSWEYAFKALYHGYRSETAGIPLFPAQAVVPVGAFVMCLQLIIDFIHDINSLYLGTHQAMTEDEN